MQDPSYRRRFDDLNPERLSQEQRRVYDAIIAGPRGVVQGPLRIWLESPELAEKAQELGAFCRYGTHLPARLSELAIIIVGAHWRAGFEWAVHAPLAIKAGIDPDIVEALRTDRTPQWRHDDEEIVYRFSSEMLEQRKITDATFDAAISVLGRKETIELLGILGYYTLICMTIVGFLIPPPEDVADPWPAS